MWARVIELMLGAWLVLTPFIFRGTDHIDHFIARDIAVGSAVVVLALLSFWRRAGRAHLLTAALAGGLAAIAYFGWDRPGPPAAENEITIALLLVMFGIIPNEAALPPEPWRQQR